MNLYSPQEAKRDPVLIIARKVFMDYKTDTGVLSTNHSQYIEKVKRGDYIYIGDITALHAASAKDCELVIGKTLMVFPLYYAFALRNNPAYILQISTTCE